ncbi:nuclear pore complex subunit [bacterium 336/3]|jgi:SiaC family regulatory phosphoprotein|nr:nuclear pore complex subunit [bacterium 336/3]
METFRVDKTSNTPFVQLDADTGRMEIKGRSVPENPLEFYIPINDWLEHFRAQAAERVLSMDVELEYFNTSSSKCLLDVFKKMVAIQRSGAVVEINWWCEEFDDDMIEAGKDYQDLLGVPFNIKIIEE